MKQFSRAIAFLLVLAMFMGLAPINRGNWNMDAEAEIFSGEIDGWTYYFNDEDGTLVIIGQGAMPDFKNAPPPWAIYADRVTKVICSEGITSISEGAFPYFSKLETVVLPATIEVVDQKAFLGCNEITNIEFAGEPEKLQQILEDNQVFEALSVTINTISTTSLEAQVTTVVATTEPEVPSAYTSYVTASGRVARDRGDSSSEPANNVVSTVVAGDVVEFEYYVNLHGEVTIDKYVNGKLVYSEYAGPGDKPYFTYYLYDGDNLISERNVSPYGEEYTTLYEYEGDKVVRVVDKNLDGETVTTISYDGNNRVETSINSDGGKTIAKYSGDLEVSVESYASSGYLREKRESVVEGNNTIFTSTYYDRNGAVQSTYIFTSTEDGNGNIISEKESHSYQGNMTSEYFRKYDEKGNLLEDAYYRASDDGSLVLRNSEKYSYVYDGDKILSYDVTYIDSEDDSSTSHVVFSFNGDIVTGMTESNSNGGEWVSSYSYKDGLISSISNKSDDYASVYEFTRDGGIIKNVNYTAKSGDQIVSESKLEYTNTHLTSSKETDYNESGNVSNENVSTYTYASDGSILTAKSENKGEQYSNITERTYDGNTVHVYSKSEQNGKVTDERTSVRKNGKIQSEISTQFEEDGSKRVISNEYNEQGRNVLSKVDHYDRYGKLRDSESRTYAYDEKGNQTRLETASYDDNGTKLSSSVDEFTYDDRGYQKTVKTTSYDKNGTTTRTTFTEYTYNDNGYQTSHKHTEYDAKGKVQYVYEQETLLNSNNERIGSHSINTWYNYDGNGISKGITEYTYDVDHKAIAQTYVYYVNDVIDTYQEYEYQYDDQGNRVEEKVNSYDKDGSLKSYYIDQYKLDSQGRTISTETTNYDKNGKLTSSYVRESILNSEGVETGYKWTNRNENGDVTESYLYEYLRDSYGKNIGDKRTDYDEKGTVKGSALNEYIFDAQGNQIGNKSTSYNSNGKKTRVNTYYYNNNNVNGIEDLVEEYDENGQITSTYKNETLYDESGNRIGYKHTKYKADGTIDYLYDYINVYNDFGVNIGTKTVSYYADSSVIEYISDPIIDTNGNYTGYSTVYYDENGIQTGSAKFEDITDTDGTKGTKDTWYDKDGNVTSIADYYYYYKANGEWLESKIIHYYSNGKIQSVRTPEIENGEVKGCTEVYYDENGNIITDSDNTNSEPETQEPSQDPVENNTNQDTPNEQTEGSTLTDEENTSGNGESTPTTEENTPSTEENIPTTEENTPINEEDTLNTNNVDNSLNTQVLTTLNVGSSNLLSFSQDFEGLTSIDVEETTQLNNDESFTDTGDSPSEDLGYTPIDGDKTMKVTAKNVAIRKDADKTSIKVKSVNTGDLVTVKGVTDDGWYVLDDGNYIMGEFVAEYNSIEYSAPVSMVITAKNTAVRESPDTSSKSVKRLNTGDRVSVVAIDSEGWYKLDNGNYVNSNYVADKLPKRSSSGSSTSSSSSANDETATLPGITVFEVSVKLVVTADNAVTRSGAGESFAEMRLLEKGAELVAIAKTDDGTWYVLEGWEFVRAQDVGSGVKKEETVTDTTEKTAEETEEGATANTTDDSDTNTENSDDNINTNTDTSLPEATPGEALRAA